MSNWYVFHVQTGREQTACNFLNKLFDKTESIAFIPQVELIFKNSKILRKELKPMFPGYIFTESILREEKFLAQVYKYIRFSTCIFELLGRKNIDFMKLTDDEKSFLLGFCDDDYIAEESKGFIIGNLELWAEELLKVCQSGNKWRTDIINLDLEYIHDMAECIINNGDIDKVRLSFIKKLEEYSTA